MSPTFLKTFFFFISVNDSTNNPDVHTIFWEKSFVLLIFSKCLLPHILLYKHAGFFWNSTESAYLQTLNTSPLLWYATYPSSPSWAPVPLQRFLGFLHILQTGVILNLTVTMVHDFPHHYGTCHSTVEHGQSTCFIAQWAVSCRKVEPFLFMLEFHCQCLSHVDTQ